MSISKLLTDNIDTLNAIAKGKKWQCRINGGNWGAPLFDPCPLWVVLNGYEIRLAPEKKWFDFSHAPEKRPKGKCVVEHKSINGCVIAQFSPSAHAWLVGEPSFAYTDHEMWSQYDRHHEDGAVTPFGVEVEG